MVHDVVLVDYGIPTLHHVLVHVMHIAEIAYQFVGVAITKLEDIFMPKSACQK